MHFTRMRTHTGLDTEEKTSESLCSLSSVVSVLFPTCAASIRPIIKDCAIWPIRTELARRKEGLRQNRQNFFWAVWTAYTISLVQVRSGWQSLKDCSLQRLSETRWDARTTAVKPFANHLPSIIEPLDTIPANCSLTNEARLGASGLKFHIIQSHRFSHCI